MTDFPKNLQMNGVSHPSILNDGYPMRELLLKNNPPELPENSVGPYRDVLDYLNVHYDLLTEDFLGPIRKGLKEYKCKDCPDTWNKVRVFKKVSFTSVSSEHSRGKYMYVNCFLDLMENEVLEEPSFGSLLVFSRGDFDDLFLGRVFSNRDKNGTIVIEVELKLPADYQLKELGCSYFTMMEGDAFYYTYQHVLKVLNLLNEQSFPMKKYIVYGTRDTQMGHPSYLSVLTLFKIFDIGFVPVLNLQKWPSNENLDMDESQFSALKAALSKEVAVIYGAPGTGKTYFGVRLVKVLLDNINTWNMNRCNPILIVCQSNQALDHFMENLLKYTDKIVRIGDQCQSLPLMPYSLKELVCRQYVRTSASSVTNYVKCILDNIDTTRQEIKRYQPRPNSLRKKLEGFEDDLHEVWDRLPNKYANSLQVLKSSYVVGLTSTGAAARREYLEELQAPIVIIEEAGEMLEAHTVVSMTEHCQHLILLGDLKQLKPVVNTFHLARDYNLNISLFERLLTSEITEGNSLTTQYRMRPEISALLRPHIYGVLDDAPITLNRRHVRGMSTDVFFLDHRQEERKVENYEGFWNPQEVVMLINLAFYLVVCHKYSPSDIAIITMYKEQKKKLIQARDQLPSLLDVEVDSVDAYQGKENEIILLSLVRSNSTNHIGFLKEENRIGVALSRARSGLYIMGNMDCLQRNPVWNDVRRCLEKNGQIGPKLTLQCEEHQTSREVSRIEDWDFKFCPSCSYETTKIGDTFDRPVFVEIPQNTCSDIFRRDAGCDYVRDVWRDHDTRSCCSEQWGLKVFVVLIGALTFAIFFFLCRFFMRYK